MNHRKVLTKVLSVAVILYGVSRLETTDGLYGVSVTYAQDVPGQPVAPTAAGPDIFFSEKTFEFGSIVQNEKVHHVFQFENRGTANLEIGDVRGSCGCTAALATEKVIPPGGKGSIDVTFDSAGKQGKQQKSVTVNSNDPDSPSVVLMLEGTITTVLEIDPGFVSFGNGLPKGQPVIMKVKLWRPDGQAFQVTGIESDHAAVTATAAPFSADGKNGQELSLTLGDKAEPGRISGAIRFQTDIPQAKEQSVRFFGSVSGSVRVTPKYAILGTVPLGQTASKTLVIETAPNEPALEIFKVTPPDNGVSAELKTVDAGHKFELLVTVSDKAARGSLRGEILLETNLADEKILRVPVYGFVGDENEPPADAKATEPGH